MKKVLFVVCLFVLFFSSARSQVVDSMISVYADQVPDQKVHVHFDKDVYRAGETIWFKAYLFSGFSLSVNSRTFYAELINDKGKILQRKIYPVIESAAAGSFDLPDSMPAVNLIYRGYTTWMLNFDTAFIFQKSITVTDRDGVVESKKPAAVSKNTLLQFFPEGGNMVNKLESVVAFKANDDYGMPVKVKGNIVNSKGTVVTTFASAHDGMGTVTLTPEENETYQATWVDPSGKQQTTALPAAKTQGIVLKLTATGNKKIFVITRTDDVPEGWKKLNVVAILGQQRVYKAVANLETNKVISGAIPVDNFPSGVMQVTVFSENWEPVAERILLVNNDNYHFDVKVNTLEINTAFRSKNTLEVEVPDTLLTNLSLSVTDAAVGRQTFADNIISRMLLTGDIKGFVYNPGYYFSNRSDSVAANLDLVMLTHGWRRYNWSLLAKGRKPALKFPADLYLGIDAKVFGVTTASPLRSDEELFIILQGKDSSKQMLQMPKTGPDKFSIRNVVFYDTATIFYQFMKDRKADEQMAVAFNTNFYKGVRQIDLVNRPVALQIDSSMLARTKFLGDKLSQYGNKFATGNVLQTVTVKTRAKSRLQELDDKYASGLFKGDDGYFFDLTSESQLGYQDIFSYLQGRVAGLQISGTSPNVTLSWRGSSTSLYLNEMEADVSMISSVNVADIAYVKVLRPPFLGSVGGGAGGAVAIYTRKGGDVKAPEGKGLSRSIVAGYSSMKEFYSPNYKDLAASADVAADYRSTLLWKPVLLTDASRQKIRVEFYNNDITKAYRVVLEGVNEVGKMVRIEKVIQQPK